MQSAQPCKAKFFPIEKLATEVSSLTTGSRICVYVFDVVLKEKVRKS